MGVTMGIDVGQRRESSAICVVEVEERYSWDRPVDHFSVRRLERLPPGTTYPEVAQRSREVVAALRKQKKSTEIFVDVTGLGDSVVDLIQRTTGRSITAVYFTHGDRRHKENGAIRLGKAWLVARVQTLLQSGELHMPDSNRNEEFIRDLLDFRITLTQDANERHGAFPVGRHDDLVTALGIAVQESPARITHSRIGI